MEATTLFYAVDGFIEAQTNGPTETKFWKPLDSIFSEAFRITDHFSQKKIKCEDFIDIAAIANNITLCAYLQGFYDLAWEVTKKQIEIISKMTCPCAHIYGVQPWINLVRLARAITQPYELEKALAGLAAVLDRYAEADSSSLLSEVPAALIDGGFMRSVQGVPAIETAKLKWLIGDYITCEKLVRPLASDSSIAMELWIRCLITLGRLDEAIYISSAFVDKHGWLSLYASIALLRGGMYSEAKHILDSIKNKFDLPLPLLRVACEFARTKSYADAADLASQIVEVSISSQQEVPALLAASLLMTNGNVMKEHLHEKITCMSSKSKHYPSVALFKFVLARSEKKDQEMDMAIKISRYIHKASLYGLSQYLPNNKIKTSSALCLQSKTTSAVKKSFLMTKDAATKILTTMSAHS